MGPIDLGSTVRVAAYVPTLVLSQFDEVAGHEGLSRSAAIVDAMGWWHVRKRCWAVRSERAKLARERTPRELQLDREARDLAIWLQLLREDGDA